MKKIGIIGAGNIGTTIAAYLRTENFNVTLADKIGGNIRLDVNNEADLVQLVRANDIIISAAPYFLNNAIVTACVANGKAYFDLTEDIAVTNYIKTLEDSFMMPQCGLAPGAVNIIANHLIQQFDETVSVDLRVGALPRYPSNEMGYYLAWSTDGLINEYCNMCDILLDGEMIKVPPMEGLETIYIDGTKYEAFNTSGGVGTLCETYKDRVQNINYKTMRYPGHHILMKFLVNDLNMANNKEAFREIFDCEVPYTTDDIVTVFVKVTGYLNGRLVEKTYHRDISGDDQFTAIQRTTASGICANVMAYISGELKGEGFIRQEDLSFETFTNNRFGKVYE